MSEVVPDGFLWSPPWHDDGEALRQLIEFAQKRENGSPKEERSYWLGISIFLFNALGNDLMIARAAEDVDPKI